MARPARRARLLTHWHVHLYTCAVVAGCDLKTSSQFANPLAHPGQAHAGGAGSSKSLQQFTRDAYALIFDGEGRLL